MEGIVSNLVSKSLEAMGKAALKEVASWWGARRELKKLEKTMRLIKARVHDAEKRQEEDGSEAIKEWLRRLKLVLYQADDLFDESLTLGRQKLHMESNRMFGKVGILFSKSGPLYYNINLAFEIRSIRKELEDIKSDMSVLNLRDLPPQQLPMNSLIDKRETASLVNTDYVISRDNDQNNILKILFDPKDDVEKVTVIPIVGFGGLGKTTLAQLVFNDQRVKMHFDLAKWAYVPEKDNLNLIKRKIYKSFTDKSYNDLSLDQIQQGIRESIDNKKYLLVLDDIWDEGVGNLNDLMSLLRCGNGNQGSKVIVTTRSDVVARVVGTIDRPYMLGTLTDGQSWDLFKLVAFKHGKEDDNPTFTKIGKEIVNMCGNVPLAIKVVGGILRSKYSEKEWLQARDAQRSKAQLTKGDDIMDVLKLSYDYLPPALKQCFAYCSLFPKGSYFDRDDLVHMWMAQGYCEASNSITGDLLYMNMLAKGLFQDPEFSAYGTVVKCKMHDLLHDLAQHVAGEESMILNDESSSQVTHGLVHVKLFDQEASSSLFVARRMRSFISTMHHNDLKGLSRLKYLRLLKVEGFGIQKLPNTIGKLMHLRYLYIEGKFTERLPDFITRLENLQTLNVQYYINLVELPSDFAKMANIKHLFLPCELWAAGRDLPVRFERLTSLEVLNKYIVGENNGIDSLPVLNYSGNLDIKICKWRRNAIQEAQRANLKNCDELNSLQLIFAEDATPPNDEMNEMLMNLQLPPNLKGLRVCDYKGEKMPGRWLDRLSNLVSITIERCKNCKVVPRLSQLPNLKKAELFELDDLEYVEDEDNVWVSDYRVHIYFPSLEVLKLDRLPQLKGWARASMDNCEIRSMPLAPKLEFLYLNKIKWKVFESNDENKASRWSSSSLFTAVKKVEMWFVKSVSMSICSSMCNLSELEIIHCEELRNLRFNPLNSINKVKIEYCYKLRNIKGLQHLSNLETLQFHCCNELEILEEEAEEGSSSRGMTSLRELKLEYIPKLKKLPLSIACATTLEQLTIKDLENIKELPAEIGNLSQLCRLFISCCPKVESLPTSFQGLTSLESFKIRKCPRLKSLPTSLLKLTSLEYLGIYECPILEERYKQDGEDWHLIQHIPTVIIY